MTCQICVIKEDDWYVATDVVSNVSSQGKSINEALDNVKEALELYYEDNEDAKAEKTVFFTTVEVCN